MSWRRLKEAELKWFGGILPSKVVLEQDQDDHTFRTFLETFNGGGTPCMKAGRYFYWEGDALADFDKRLGRLPAMNAPRGDRRAQ